jgi:hypothetical protein
MNRLKKLAPIGILVLAVAAMGAKGCPTFPKIEERIVELAVGGSVTLPWEARGVINNYNDTGTYDLGAELDLQSILDDADLDATDVKSISISGVSYRITVPDPNAGRTIENGTVTAQRQGSGVVNLITDFDADASAKTGWISAPLSSAGINMLNGILADALNSAQNGGPIPNGNVTFTVSGVSNPQGVTTNFDWELRVDISVVGEFKTDVLN